MDRNQNWDRIQLAYDLITQGLSEYQCKNSKEAIEMAYARGESDEFVMPTAIVDEKGTAVSIKEGDAIVFANYRADRARQLTLAFTKTDFNSFIPKNLNAIVIIPRIIRILIPINKKLLK